MTTELDTTGMLCPLPVLKARKALTTMADGELLVVLATDPGASQDFVSFCDVQGHELVATSQEGEVLRFEIRKGAG